MNFTSFSIAIFCCLIFVPISLTGTMDKVDDDCPDHSVIEDHLADLDALDVIGIRNPKRVCSNKKRLNEVLEQYTKTTNLRDFLLPPFATKIVYASMAIIEIENNPNIKRSRCATGHIEAKAFEQTFENFKVKHKSQIRDFVSSEARAFIAEIKVFDLRKDKDENRLEELVYLIEVATLFSTQDLSILDFATIYHIIVLLAEFESYRSEIQGSYDKLNTTKFFNIYTDMLVHLEQESFFWKMNFYSAPHKIGQLNIFIAMTIIERTFNESQRFLTHKQQAEVKRIFITLHLSRIFNIEKGMVAIYKIFLSNCDIVRIDLGFEVLSLTIYILTTDLSSHVDINEEHKLSDYQHSVILVILLDEIHIMPANVRARWIAGIGFDPITAFQIELDKHYDTIANTQAEYEIATLFVGGTMAALIKCMEDFGAILKKISATDDEIAEAFKLLCIALNRVEKLDGMIIRKLESLCGLFTVKGSQANKMRVFVNQKIRTFHNFSDGESTPTI